ncbi:MAG: hypothetical protein ACI9KD_003236, partial [Congregibacter sp.]
MFTISRAACVMVFLFGLSSQYVQAEGLRYRVEGVSQEAREN